MKEKHDAKWHMKKRFALKSYWIPRVEAQSELIENMQKYLTVKKENLLKEIQKSRDALK